MSFNSNGQISYLVLDSLAENSKYGLEIIEYISKKTGGTFLMKKPTLYSCLNRMEKKEWISSSYWGESELGGKRHYYTITTSGRRELENLTRLFGNIKYDNIETKEEKDSAEGDFQTTKVLQQDNIFDMVQVSAPAQNVSDDEDEEDDVAENQIDMFSMEPIEQKTDDGVLLESETHEDDEKIKYYQSKLEQEPEPTPDDGVFLEEDEHLEQLTPDQEEQNKRLYDTSSELKKYRKRKSFSENQIEMAVEYVDDNYDEIQKERIAELKKSLTNIRQNGASMVEESTTLEQNMPTFAEETLPFEREYVQNNAETEDEPTDDGLLITEPRINEKDIPVQRKITPPNIEVNLDDGNLPAPKRNSELEPTYRDMMSKLFERKKEKDKSQQPVATEIQMTQNQAVTNFTDYASLKKYYNSQGISFNEYKKTTVYRKHNTNLLNLISSAILLVISGIGCAILFGIIAGTHNLRAGTNFMFYTLPLLFLVMIIVDAFLVKFTKSRRAVLIYNASANWVVFVLSTIVVLVINLICGMQFETIGAYSTSLFVPIFGLLLVLPVDYYIRKYLYKKFAK